jgi:hypothetical protein
MEDNEKLQWFWIKSPKKERLFLPWDFTQAAEVDGGWLVAYVYYKGAVRSTHATVFVPDRERKWNPPEYVARWERCYVDRNSNWNHTTERLRLPHGSLFKNVYGFKQTITIELVFVPNAERSDARS